MRSLLQLLVEHERLSRAEVLARLWPDLDRERGLNNLRVNLSYLNELLEPGRSSDDPPFFVRTSDDLLHLVDHALVELDVTQFDEEVDAGRAAEAAGHPERALTHYLDAVELYRGDYLSDAQDWDWGHLTRTRLSGALAATAVRAGELLLASGRPDRAVKLAARAAAAEPFLEAAQRLQARALATAGDRAGAHSLLGEAIARIRSEDLEPEDETLALLDSLATGAA